MIGSKDIFLVKNRSASRVTYRIPNMNIRREFAPGQTLKITFEELQALMFEPGGAVIISQFLQVQSEKVLDELSVQREYEYNFSEEDIIKLIKFGHIDQFKDCIDFAPQGVIDLVKKYAVEIPMESTSKIEYLKEKTGFDVPAAIKNMKADKEDEEKALAAAGGDSAGGRRMAVPGSEPESPVGTSARRFNINK